MTSTPVKPTPAIPSPLSGVAAAIDATHVPWPLGSMAGSLPNADQPGPVGTSFDCTPVSSTAIVAIPDGVVVPYTWSHPICGSAHCEPYAGSFGVASASRVRSRSTDFTRGSLEYSATDASALAAGTSTTKRRSAPTDETVVPPPAAIASVTSASLNPLTSRTRSVRVADGAWSELVGEDESDGEGASVDDGTSLGASVAEVSAGLGSGEGESAGASVADGEGSATALGSDVAGGAVEGSVLGASAEVLASENVADWSVAWSLGK